MAGMCCGMNMGETDTSSPVVPSSGSSRRRRMELHQFNFLPSDSAVAPLLEGSGVGRKRRMMDAVVPARESVNGAKKCQVEEKQKDNINKGEKMAREKTPLELSAPPAGSLGEFLSFGLTSVCGLRRDMEDAVAVHASFDPKYSAGLHFFGVYDGHGCSHVATKCRDRMHEIVKAEIHDSCSPSWQQIMAQSFSKMDKEAGECSGGGKNGDCATACRCELRTPQCDAVGSTAVVAVVTPDKIIVSNCGDSRAVLCRKRGAIPLSVDHKPDRPDELNRIQEAGGRVIYWDGPRVLGVLAMSRAIGDNYLKPYVISEPEVTVTERTADDECLILASDGLWDVVSSETACGVASMCLKFQKAAKSPGKGIKFTAAGGSSDQACSDASILLTKLALARHTADNVSVVVVDLRRS